MSKIPLINIRGDKLGEVDLSDSLLVFDRGEQAVHDVIVAYQAGLRAGTASTLTKSTVAGSNKKPWRQKGLGRARAGYKQSPIWRGGGVAFGPHPRSYAKKVQSKVARLAFCRAFSEKVAGNLVRVVDDLTINEAKTKVLAAILKVLNLRGKVLLLIGEVNQNLTRASRNIPEVEVILAREVNTFQLFRYTNVLVSRSALAILENRLKSRGRARKKL